MIVVIVADTLLDPLRVTIFTLTIHVLNLTYIILFFLILSVQYLFEARRALVHSLLSQNTHTYTHAAIWTSLSLAFSYNSPASLRSPPPVYFKNSSLQSPISLIFIHALILIIHPPSPLSLILPSFPLVSRFSV